MTLVLTAVMASADAVGANSLPFADVSCRPKALELAQ
jgi:hypothetical protein